MKRILTMAIAMFAMATTTASAIELVIPAGNKGGIYTISKHLNAELAKIGVETNMDVQGSCPKGMAKFRSTDKPSIYIASSAKNSSHTFVKGCDFTEAQFEEQYVAPAFMAVMALCTPKKGVKFSDLKGQGWKTYTIGTDASRAWAAQANMEAAGLKVKTVNYKNSSAARAGMMAGDVDFFWSNAKEAPKVADAGGECILATSADDFNGVPGMKSVTGVDPIGGSNIYWVAARNMDAAQLKSIKAAVEQVVTSPSTQEWAASKWFITINGKSAADLKAEAKDYVTVFTVDR